MVFDRMHTTAMRFVLTLALVFPSWLAFAPKQAEAAGYGVTIETVAGSDRFETAVAISQKSYPSGADGVIIAYSQDFPDALAASSIAGAKGYPILLTRTDALSSDTIEEINRLGATEAIIVGGTAVVSQDVETQLETTTTVDEVKRYGGADRIETAELILESLLVDGDVSIDTLVLVTATDFADSASISPFVAQSTAPILLVPSGGELTESSKALIERYTKAAVGAAGDASGSATQSDVGSANEQSAQPAADPASDSDTTVAETVADTTAETKAEIAEDTVAGAIEDAIEGEQTDGTAPPEDSIESDALMLPDVPATTDTEQNGSATHLIPQGGITEQSETFSGFERVVIAGGTSVVSQATENYMRALFPTGQSEATTYDTPVVRLAGADRYLTARAVTDWCVANESFTYTTTGLASGYKQNAPDALTAGPYLGQIGVPLLLANDSLHALASLRAFLQEDRVDHFIVFGGTGAVTQPVHNEILYGPLPPKDATDTTLRKTIVTVQTTAHLAPSLESPVLETWGAGTAINARPYDAAGTWYVATVNGRTVYYPTENVVISYGGSIVDLSYWNSRDSKQVTNTAYQYLDLAILRTGYGTGTVDWAYPLYTAQCERYGVPYGAYHYATFTSSEGARQQARIFWGLARASGCDPNFYVLDIEDELTGQSNANMRTYAAAFLDEMRILGAQKVGVYVGHHRYVEFNVDYDAFDFVWIPRYGANDGNLHVDKPPAYPYDMWQYTSQGSVAGIQGVVDLNILNENGPNRRTLSWYAN